jgi:ABC-type Mn2+/Zn2+ transport system permease subunit/Mn-dependent DtxR family transcriptional regulator
MLEILNYDYAIRALIASSIVGVACGVLGCFVVLRRMALIGDALSHAILPGVVIGFVFFGHNPLAIFLGAVVAGLITSIIITWVQRNSITKDDASIGIVFTAMFAIGIIGISWITKKQGVHLDMKDFLFGNVLGVSDSDLWLTGLIGIYVIACISVFFKYFFITTFDPLIALTMGISVAVIHYFLMFLLSLTIVASLQSVGVILVVAMLIIPSSAAYLLTDKLKYMLMISAFIGFISATGGFLISVWLEITPGPTMTLVAATLFGLSLLLSPKRGYFVMMISKTIRRYAAGQQDVIKTVDKLSINGKVSFDILKNEFNLAGKKILKIHLWHLQQKKLLKLNNNEISLTVAGKHEADTLVRAHRLWESYLVNKMNVPMDQIHESAEEMEHVLPKDFVDKVEKDLGFPTSDPHGSPIPKIRKKQSKLSDLKSGEHGIILNEQSGAIKELWHLGIFPNSDFVVEENTSDYVKIIIKNEKFVINKSGAEKIKIKH